MQPYKKLKSDLLDVLLAGMVLVGMALLLELILLEGILLMPGMTQPILI